MFPGTLCASLTPRRMAEVFAANLDGVDSVEVRLDYLANPLESMDVEWTRLARPVIATCRRVEHGGRFRGSRAEEMEILERAARNGARWVDIDYRFACPVAGAEVIASFHDFDRTPADLAGLAEAVSGSDAGAAKVAVRTDTWNEVGRVLDLLKRPWPKPFIAIGMGPVGELTRVVGPSRGSALTYASAGEASAPGQLSVSELLGTFRFRSIGPETRLVGIVGNPVGHSMSPELHNRAFDRAGLDYVYLRFPVDSLPDFFGFAGAAGIVGVSVTIPHKVAVQDFLDEVSPAAREAGAVNTVWRTSAAGAPPAWAGDNTDVHGVREALAGLDLESMRVIVLGTGGAARAAVAALKEARSVKVLSRSRGHARLDWARPVEVAHLDVREARGADLLINATPVGMSPNADQSPLPGPPEAGVVFDMVYNPERTRLLREAEARGQRVISGKAMFLAQAARQFEIWTGETANPAVFSGAA